AVALRRGGRVSTEGAAPRSPLPRLSLLVSLSLFAAATPSAAIVDHPQEALTLLLRASGTRQKLVYLTRKPEIVLPTTSPLTTGATLEIRNLTTAESGTLDMPVGE